MHRFFEGHGVRDLSSHVALVLQNRAEDQSFVLFVIATAGGAEE